MTAKHLMAWS